MRVGRSVPLTISPRVGASGTERSTAPQPAQKAAVAALSSPQLPHFMLAIFLGLYGTSLA
jgi:hypothetical protein